MAVEWKECSRLAINLAIKITCQCLWQHSCRTSSWEILITLGVQTVEFQCLQLSTSNQFAERNHLYTRAGHKPTKHPGCIAENRMYFTRIQYFAWNLYWSLSLISGSWAPVLQLQEDIAYSEAQDSVMCSVGRMYFAETLLSTNDPCTNSVAAFSHRMSLMILHIIWAWKMQRNITKQVFPASLRFNFKTQLLCADWEGEKYSSPIAMRARRDVLMRFNKGKVH